MTDDRIEGTENRDEAKARELFEALGADVERVSASNWVKRPDFLVRFGDDAFYLEVKGKADEEDRASWVAAVHEKGIESRVKPVERQNKLSSIFREAAEQLAGDDLEPGPYRFIFFSVLGGDARLITTSMEATAYGIRDGFVMDTEVSKLRAVRFYYFDHNEFFSAPHVDAMVLSRENEWCLCLNAFSPRIDDLLASSIPSIFNDGVVNPLADEQRGTAYIVSTPIPRSDTGAVLQFLYEKYDAARIFPAAAARQVEVAVWVPGEDP